jgi:hypothetical protein
MVHSVRHDFFKGVTACSEEIDRARVVGLGVSTFVYQLEGETIHIVQIFRKAFLVKWLV